MKTGKQVIFDEDLGETQNWYFHTDGSRKGQASTASRTMCCMYTACVRKLTRTCALHL